MAYHCADLIARFIGFYRSEAIVAITSIGKGFVRLKA
jgi:hypothetical protein